MMAPLQSGIRIVNAPHFHNVRSWNDRLRLNSGVVQETNRVVARDDWRLPTPDELLLLTATEWNADTLALFSIPDRLHSRWWSHAAESAGNPEAEQVGFQKFAGEILEFLQFKRLPLPSASTVEVVVQAPGQDSTRGGLTAERPFGEILGGINLSDEESAVVFLNVVNEEAKSFFARCGDYPLIKISLRPGEGFWLPRCPIVIDGDTRGRAEIDVQLVIRAGQDKNRDRGDGT